MIKYKHIEAARELRLWIGQVMVPAITASIFIASNPNARAWIKEKTDDIKKKIKKES